MQKFIILLLLFLSSSAFSAKKDSIVERIFNEIYNQHYSQAEKMLRSNQENIDSVFFVVLSVDLSYWKNVTGTNTPDYQSFENHIQDLSPINPASTTHQAIRMVTLSYQLRYELKRFKLMKAISTR
ncbi:hypothetical protein [uncultured Draconibacterium sp.]|nr:hypothetical protein [uncultured Draconibacterium sp.]